jgi:hypothetical protein
MSNTPNNHIIIHNVLERSYLETAPGGGKIPFFLRTGLEN